MVNKIKNKKKKHAGGRPAISFDDRQWAEFERLCGIQCTKVEIQEWFRVTDKTLDRLIEEKYKMSFSDIFAQKRTRGLVSLRRRQFELAQRNVAMAIFLGKNYLGQVDKQEFSGDIDADITVQLID